MYPILRPSHRRHTYQFTGKVGELNPDFLLHLLYLVQGMLGLLILFRK